MNQNNLADRIVTFLQNEKEPIPTLQLAKGVGFKTAKEVNPTLYSMQGNGIVVKTADPNGANPKWTLTGSSTRPDVDRLDPIKQQITRLSREEVMDLFTYTKTILQTKGGSP